MALVLSFKPGQSFTITHEGKQLHVTLRHADETRRRIKAYITGPIEFEVLRDELIERGKDGNPVQGKRNAPSSDS